MYSITGRADPPYTQNTQATQGPRNTRGPPCSQRFTICNVTSVMYLSYLINIIGSVIEQVSVYWHKISFTSGSYSFLDTFLTLLHYNLTSNHAFMFS